MSPELSFSPAPFQRVARAPEGTTGYADGYAAGWAAGSRAAVRAAAVEQRRLAEEAAARAHAQSTALQTALEALARVTESVRRTCAPVLADAQELLARAAVELAQTLLGLELAEGDTAARAALARAMALPEGADLVRVRLNPDDLARVRAGLGALAPPDGIELAADGRLERGDAVADLAEGIIDARITTALDRARRALEVPE